MTDLATTYILLSNTDKLKEQVWFHQDELIKLREQYKQLEAERGRLRETLKWYEEKAKKATVSYPHWEDAYGDIVGDGGRRARNALEGKDDD